jgi:hypothetical protein
VPSLRVNIHVLASHTPQGSKAAELPTRSGSRRRAQGETKPQHALEPARSLESCVCLRQLHHSKRMGTLSSALGSRGCEQPAPCVPRLPGLALPPGRSGPPTEGAVASCPHAIVVSPLLMARAPSIAHAQPAVRTLVGGPESASSKAASLATAAATQPLAPSSAPATLPAPMRLPFCAPSYLLLGLPDPAPLAPCSSHGRWSHSDAIQYTNILNGESLT